MFVKLKIAKFDGMHGLRKIFFGELGHLQRHKNRTFSLKKKKETSCDFFFAKLQHFKVTFFTFFDIYIIDIIYITGYASR